MRVLHVLSRLNRSGMERMLECSHELWAAADVEPIIVGMADGDHPYAHALQARGYRVIELPTVRSARGLGAFRHLLQAVCPEIVHIHQESCFDAIALLSNLSRSVEGVVYTVHNSFPFTGNLRVRRKVRAACSQRLRVTWVACAEQVADNERSRFGNPTLVVENWVDVTTIVVGATKQARKLVRKELGIPPGIPVLALIGNCGKAKNHELIPGALSRIPASVHVLHVGERSGITTAECASWPHLPERHVVHHLGARDDIPALLAACDLLLLPSRYEGLPLVAIEALCAGVPVLAADVPALQWLSPFPSAILSPLDPGAWGSAIETAVTHDWSAEVKLSSETAQSRFNPSRGVTEYTAIYERVFHHRTPRDFIPEDRRKDVSAVRSN